MVIETSNLITHKIHFHHHKSETWSNKDAGLERLSQVILETAETVIRVEKNIKDAKDQAVDFVANNGPLVVMGAAAATSFVLRKMFGWELNLTLTPVSTKEKLILILPIFNTLISVALLLILQNSHQKSISIQNSTLKTF